jgi:hypothetical protein
MWLGGGLLVVGGVVALGIAYPNTAKEPAAAPRSEPGQVYVEPKTVRLTNADRQTALRTALRFVNTAVARRNVDDSYALVTPELRQGMSKSEWANGEIPVVPFPATEVRVRIDYSYANELGLKMLLMPPSTSELVPATFNLDMRGSGPEDRKRWLVSAWTPSSTAAPQTDIAPTSGQGSSGASASGLPNLGDQQPEGLNAPLGAAWIIVPLGILGLVLLVPIGLGIRSWLENRRALREYEKTRPLDV